MAKNLILLFPFIMPIAAVFGLIMFHSVPILPNFGSEAAVIAMSVAVLLLIVSKWRFVVKLRVTFGSAEMNRHEKILYRLSYFFLFIGILFGIFSESN